MKPLKPKPPTREEVYDYRCFDENEDWNEEEDPGEIFRYYTRKWITLKELNEKYKDYNPEVIIICSEYVEDRSSCLGIMRPENDEEFAARFKLYERELAEYNKWIKENTSDAKKHKVTAKKLAKLAKLKEEAERLQKEIYGF